MMRHLHTRLAACFWILAFVSPASCSRETGVAVAGSPPSAIRDGWRESLPPGLRERKGAPLHRIDMNGVVIYLLGSSHVSRTSCDDAKLLMDHIRPDALFVELCSQRVGMLLDAPASSESDEQPQQDKTKHVETSPLARGSLLFTKIQSDYARKLNVTIGGEMKTAFESALSQERGFWASQQSSPWGLHAQSLPPTNQEYGFSAISHPRGNRRCAVVLGDRPVRITLIRAWESLRWFGKVKLMLGLLWSSIRQPSETELKEWMESILNDRTGKNDLITKAMEELDKAFPSLKRVIISERDEFMVAKLRQTAAALLQNRNDGEDRVIVALVGAGHCSGILEMLQMENEKSPILTLHALLDTKRRTISPEELSSLVNDVVLFDYAYIWDSENRIMA